MTIGGTAPKWLTVPPFFIRGPNRQDVGDVGIQPYLIPLHLDPLQQKIQITFGDSPVRGQSMFILRATAMCKSPALRRLLVLAPISRVRPFSRT